VHRHRSVANGSSESNKSLYRCEARVLALKGSDLSGFTPNLLLRRHCSTAALLQRFVSLTATEVSTRLVFFGVHTLYEVVPFAERVGRGTFPSSGTVPVGELGAAQQRNISGAAVGGGTFLTEEVRVVKRMVV
jgi:hypothetical protein